MAIYLRWVWAIFFVVLSSAAFSAQMPIEDYQPDNFGWRFMSSADYTSNGVGYSVFHPATDLNAVNDGTGRIPVYAIADGEVVANESGWGGIVIRHTFDNRYYYSQYGHIYHLEDESSVDVGVQVREGQQIGFIGNTGMGTQDGHHLHFEIRSPHHPDPNNAGYWGSLGRNIDDRREVFIGYESPLAFVRSHENQGGMTVIIDSAVTYPGIENNIINNEVYDDYGNPIKQNFFKAWNLSEWNTFVPGVGESRGFDGNYHYARTTNGNESSAGKWYFRLPEDGDYEVRVNIPANHATSEHATYEIYHNNKYDYVEVDQSKVTGNLDQRWVSLGSFDFAVGSDHYVKLGNATGENNKYIGLDAIQIISVNESDNKITRANALKLILDKFDISTKNAGFNSTRFGQTITPPSDVTKDIAYYDAIVVGYNRGIVGGNSGLFEPTRDVSLQEFLTMIVRTIPIPLENPVYKNYYLLDQNNAFYKYVNAAYNAGIIDDVSYDFTNGIDEGMANSLLSRAFDYFRGDSSGISIYLKWDTRYVDLDMYAFSPSDSGNYFIEKDNKDYITNIAELKSSGNLLYYGNHSASWGANLDYDSWGGNGNQPWPDFGEERATVDSLMIKRPGQYSFIVCYYDWGNALSPEAATYQMTGYKGSQNITQGGVLTGTIEKNKCKVGGTLTTN